MATFDFEKNKKNDIYNKESRKVIDDLTKFFTHFIIAGYDDCVKRLDNYQVIRVNSYI